jgi:hypothetical protein
VPPLRLCATIWSTTISKKHHPNGWCFYGADDFDANLHGYSLEPKGGVTLVTVFGCKKIACFQKNIWWFLLLNPIMFGARIRDGKNDLKRPPLLRQPLQTNKIWKRRN